MQCTLEFFWREINCRDFVSPHHLEEILKVTPTTSPDPLDSDVLLDVMLSLPSLLHTPSLESELAVVVPPAHMSVPFDTGSQSGCRSGPGHGQAQQPLEVC